MDSSGGARVWTAAAARGVDGRRGVGGAGERGGRLGRSRTAAAARGWATGGRVAAGAAGGQQRRRAGWLIVWLELDRCGVDRIG